MMMMTAIVTCEERV